MLAPYSCIYAKIQFQLIPIVLCLNNIWKPVGDVGHSAVFKKPGFDIVHCSTVSSDQKMGELVKG